MKCICNESDSGCEPETHNGGRNEKSWRLPFSRRFALIVESEMEMRTSLLMWRRWFLMVSTPEESDRIFTYFYVSMTPAVVVQVQALVGKLKLCQRSCLMEKMWS